MKLHIVMYHYVRELASSRYPGIKGLDLDLFSRQIFFLKNNYNIISCEQLLDAVENGLDIPDNSALLTFDDGYIDHYINVLPILMEHKLTALFSMPGKIIAEGKVLDVNKIHFILASASPTILKEHVFSLLDKYRGLEYDYPENCELYQELAVANRFDDADIVFIKRLLQVRLDEQLRAVLTNKLFDEFVGIPECSFAKELYMSMDQIKLMKKCGMHFGIHGYNHYWLNSLPVPIMENDIRMALDVFDGVIDKKRWIMCYPYGAYNDDVLSFISKKGCIVGVTTEVAVATEANGLLTLPRLDANDYPPKSENYMLIE